MTPGSPPITIETDQAVERPFVGVPGHAERAVEDHVVDGVAVGDHLLELEQRQRGHVVPQQLVDLVHQVGTLGLVELGVGLVEQRSEFRNR